VRSLQEAFAVWELYIDRGRESVKGLGERAMEVRYEDLVAAPAPELERLASMCGLNPTPGRMRKATSRVDRARAFRYRSDPALRAFSESVATRLVSRGYEA
jgi:hypothetical protein